MIHFLNNLSLFYNLTFKGYNGKTFNEKLDSNEKPPFYNSLREINSGCEILYKPIV
jgi:hypothetical protein